jgi:manganese/zinc/iron transport system substrate-binding protein
MRKILALAKNLCFGALLLTGCASGPAQHGDGGRVRVTTTTGLIADAARVLGGKEFDVQELMGPGIDPHLYRPTAGDLARLEKADVVLYHGLELEGRMGQVMESLKGPQRTVRAVGEAVPKDKLLEIPGAPGKHDPHVWLDPNLWSFCVAEVARALAEQAPAHKHAIQARLKAYQAELASLDQEVRRLVARVPRDRRILVTAHDAFQYFGRAFGFEVLGIQGVSTAAEASPADVRRLARFLAQRRVKAVFVETSLPPSIVNSLREASASIGWKVTVGGSLFSDALGDRGTAEGTYVGMLRHNVVTIIEALE